MKTATLALSALINSGMFAVWDLYTITMAGGGVILLTTADFNITFGGVTWSSRGPRVDTDASKALAHWKIGLDVDQWQVAVMPRAIDDFTGAAFPDTIGSAPWLQAARSGALDAATVLVQRAYFAAPPAYPIPTTGAVPVGVLTIFLGQVAEVDVNTSMAIITINDYRQLLTTQMPRNLYQSGCRHVLFDGGCTLSGAAYVKTGTVGANTTRATIIASISAPSGSGTWQLGRVVVTSGLNATFMRTVNMWDGAQTFTMVAPFPYNFALGDTFSIYPGCDKRQVTCLAFGNLLNFGGDPYIPIPETVSS